MRVPRSWEVWVYWERRGGVKQGAALVVAGGQDRSRILLAADNCRAAVRTDMVEWADNAAEVMGEKER